MEYNFIIVIIMQHLEITVAMPNHNGRLWAYVPRGK